MNDALTPPIDWLGETPWEEISDAYDNQCPEGYNMQLMGEDAEVAAAAVGQGIDSRLEAISFVTPPEWKTHHKHFRKLHMTLDKPGLLVLLRRLYEYNCGEAVDGQDEARGGAACSLRGAMLQALGIEDTS
jgi:hypothetical protein